MYIFQNATYAFQVFMFYFAFDVYFLYKDFLNDLFICSKSNVEERLHLLIL